MTPVDINFDPLVLSNRIAASDDPLLSARSAASIDSDYIIRLRTRFYHPQSFGELSRRYMMQPGDILGIRDVHEASRPFANSSSIIIKDTSKCSAIRLELQPLIRNA
jgi:hypothetical protein